MTRVCSILVISVVSSMIVAPATSTYVERRGQTFHDRLPVSTRNIPVLFQSMLRHTQALRSAELEATTRMHDLATRFSPLTERLQEISKKWTDRSEPDQSASALDNAEAALNVNIHALERCALSNVERYQDAVMLTVKRYAKIIGMPMTVEIVKNLLEEVYFQPYQEFRLSSFEFSERVAAASSELALFRRQHNIS